jgi:hypothetical protein
MPLIMLKCWPHYLDEPNVSTKRPRVKGDGRRVKVKEKCYDKTGMVAQDCDPSYSVGYSSKPAQAKS